MARGETGIVAVVKGHASRSSDRPRRSRSGGRRANRHLARRSENWRLCEVSGYFTGPLFVGGSACNPIAFELRVNASSVGETLIVELTHNGMIEAFLGPLRPGEPEAHTMRQDFGWEPIPVQNFGYDNAHDLVLRYVNAVTIHVPLDRAGSRAAAKHRSH